MGGDFSVKAYRMCHRHRHKMMLLCRIYTKSYDDLEILGVGFLWKKKVSDAFTCGVLVSILLSNFPSVFSKRNIP